MSIGTQGSHPDEESKTSGNIRANSKTSIKTKLEVPDGLRLLRLLSLDNWRTYSHAGADKGTS